VTEQRTIGGWRLLDRHLRLSPFAGQGMTSVETPAGTKVVYRGDWSIPFSLRRQGWDHIGDPSSHGGMIFDAYQTKSGSKQKLFAVTKPDGTRLDFVHTLDAGELFNNSFTCVTPDGRWMVSGEWGKISRLLVFPTPILNPAANLDLALAGAIELDRPVRNIQGATFLNPTTLLCTCDDSGNDLWPVPKQLIQIDLSGPLTGSSVSATVRLLGSLQAADQPDIEVEGIDFDMHSGHLRVAANRTDFWGQIVTYVYRFVRAPD
jgi:hypothetical protein